MIKILSLMKKGMQALCILSLLAGSVGAVYAPPAYASTAIPTFDVGSLGARAALWIQDKIDWAMNTALMQSLNAGLNAFNITMTTWFNKLSYTMTKSTTLKTGAEKGKMKAKLRTEKAINANAVEDVFLKGNMRVAAHNVPAKGAGLCNSIVLNQFAMTTEDFEQSVARMASSAIEAMYRGPTADGNGPQYAADNYALRCSAKFGNPVDMPKECVDDSVKGTDGRKIFDADLAFATITGGQVLELPEFEDVEIDGLSYVAPNPKTAEQKFWVAGLYLCFNLAGPRPSPPYGKELDTPAGRSARAQWNSCAAKQSQLIQPCVALLAHHTRPNSTMKDIVADHKKKCEAAEKLKITLPESYEGCKHGVTAYQAEELQQGICKSPQYFITQTLGGGDEPELLDTAVDCLTSWDIWQERQVIMETSVYTSVAGLLDLQQCWSKVDALKN